MKKKIFATYDEKNKKLCIKLSLIDQDIFSLSDKTVIYTLPNKWGQQGWTIVEMEKAKKELFVAALTAAYCEVAPKKLVDQMKAQKNKIFYKSRLSPSLSFNPKRKNEFVKKTKINL